MLELRELDREHAEAEYALLAAMPSVEKGFENPFAGLSFEAFRDVGIPAAQAHARGEGLPEGHVPDTMYILWEDGVAVGLFKFRHYLTPALREGSGHIGYGIGPAHRGRGLATRGLALLLDLVRDRVPEEEIYLAVDKDNPASLAVQMKNGAYLHHEGEGTYFTRIPLGK